MYDFCGSNSILVGVFSNQRKFHLEEGSLTSYIQKTIPLKFNLVSEAVGPVQLPWVKLTMPTYFNGCIQRSR